MAKSKPGMPDGFELKLSDPVQLGDYLDEDHSGNAVRALASKRAQASQPEERKAEQAPLPTSPVVKPQPSVVVPKPPPASPAARTETVLDLDEARRRTTTKAQPFRRPSRGQFNMRPETEKMFGDIVEFVQRYSLQADAKQSEIFDAIVNVLHDAKEDMAFGNVPRRGKWGTPTARAFPTALGNAFAKAIATRYAKHKAD